MILIPPPFQEYQASTVKPHPISSFPAFTKSIDTDQMFVGIGVYFPDRVDYLSIICSNIGSDTLFVEHQDLLNKVAQKKKEKVVRKEISGLTAKQLKKYSSGFIRKKLDPQKLAEAIVSGEIFTKDTSLYTSNLNLKGLSHSKLDSIYFEELPFAFGWKNLDLFPLYLTEVNSRQISLSTANWKSNSKHIAYSIFMNTSFDKRKSKLEDLFNIIKVQQGDRFEEALALWYTYYFVKSGGLTFTNSNPNAFTIQEIGEFLNTIEDGLYKKSFLLFLESLRPGDLLKQDYAFRTVSGDQIKLSNLIDKEWVLLDFWATWCQPCIRAFPELAAFYAENENKLNLLSLSVDNKFADFSKWTLRNEKKYPWPFLSATQSHPIVTNLKVSAYPSYYLIKVKTGETIGPIHKVSELKDVLDSK